MNKEPVDISPEIRTRYNEKLNWKNKEQTNNMNKIKKIIKDILLDTFQQKVIGIFGDFSHQYENEICGENVIEYVAVRSAKDNPKHLIITGKYCYVYQQESDKLVKDKTLNEALQKEIDEGFITDKHYCRVLAASCYFAIFLITTSRSSSEIEEDEFLNNEFGDKIFGLGVCIIEENETDERVECGCFEIKRVELKGNYYFLFGKKIKGETQCDGLFHSRKYALTYPFIENKFTKLVATRYWKTVPDLFNGLNTYQEQ